MDRVENVLRLAACEGVGPRTYRKLVDAFGSVEDILGASAAALSKVEGVPAKVAQAVTRAGAYDPRPEMELAAQKQVRILTQSDPDYPRPLLQTYDPPILLYIRGDLRPTDAVAIAIVGTRVPTPYGRTQAARFAGALARSGFTVVSGLARGVDSAAHHGALQARGRTLAVLGTGLGRIYPEENRDLAAEILHSGALVSEFSMETGPSRENFPRRNRIIAALTLGTLVIEAPVRSGALITARYAVEAGREVFALPGQVDHPSAEGANRLIAAGQAKLVVRVEDIFDELRDVADALCIPLTPPVAPPEALLPPMDVSQPSAAPVSPQIKNRAAPNHSDYSDNPHDGEAPDNSDTSDAPTKRPAPGRGKAAPATTSRASRADARAEAPAPRPSRKAAPPKSASAPAPASSHTDAPPPATLPGLSEQEQRIYDLIGSSKIHIDAICEAAGLPVYQVSSGLMLLELKKRVEQHPGKYFTRR